MIHDVGQDQVLNVENEASKYSNKENHSFKIIHWFIEFVWNRQKA